MSQSVSVLAVAVVVALYFLPTIIAISRGHHQTLVIVWMNLLLGWVYGLGWLIAFFWSLTAARRPAVEGTPEKPSAKKSPAWPLPPA